MLLATELKTFQNIVPNNLSELKRHFSPCHPFPFLPSLLFSSLLLPVLPSLPPSLYFSLFLFLHPSLK
jgi:hypothetical protein